MFDGGLGMSEFGWRSHPNLLIPSPPSNITVSFSDDVPNWNQAVNHDLIPTIPNTQYRDNPLGLPKSTRIYLARRWANIKTRTAMTPPWRLCTL
eukprot:gene26036-biopygen13169